jgi:two-component system phosphate regulon sensor histidine kinase PhoR
MHDVITEAAKRSALSVEALGGRLTTALNATNAMVPGDRVHLENVVHNLIDNAIKYSVDPPQVTVTTENVGGMFRMVVRDRGIGLSPDQLERVFDKYYRVPTGNVHNVKGFGIGLSYVKLVVTSFGGTVSMRSAKGAGSEVEVQLPLVG